MDHLVTFRIIVEEFPNTKTNLFCCFVDFRKAFDMVPRKKLLNRLGDKSASRVEGCSNKDV